MRVFDRSDLLAGVVVVPCFVLMTILLFGPAFTDISFWWTAVLIVGFVVVATMMRGPLGKLDRVPRAVAWFSIGFSFTTFLAFGGSYENNLVTAVGFGLFLAISELVAESYFRTKDADNG